MKMASQDRKNPDDLLLLDRAQSHDDENKVKREKEAWKRKEEEELNLLLFGPDTEKPSKPAPKKIPRLREDDDLPIVKLPSISDGQSSSFITPGLTTDSFQSSPSRQRDLLSIARDVASLQRSIASGETRNIEVTKEISFTQK